MQSKHRHHGRGYILKHQEYKTETHTNTHSHTHTHTHTHIYTHKWIGVAVTIWQNWARKLK